MSTPFILLPSGTFKELNLKGNEYKGPQSMLGNGLVPLICILMTWNPFPPTWISGEARRERSQTKNGIVSQSRSYR